MFCSLALRGHALLNHDRGQNATILPWIHILVTENFTSPRNEVGLSPEGPWGLGGRGGGVFGPASQGPPSPPPTTSWPSVRLPGKGVGLHPLDALEWADLNLAWPELTAHLPQVPWCWTWPASQRPSGCTCWSGTQPCMAGC